MAKMKLKVGIESSHFAKVARTFSQNWGVQVGFGAKARADVVNGVIELPEVLGLLDAGSPLADVVNGILDHETGHIDAERTFPAGKRPSDYVRKIQKDGGAKVALTKLWFNVYEDIRLEQSLAAKYVGVAANLRACACWAMAGQQAAHAKSPTPTGRLAAVAVICQARGMPELIEWAPKQVLDLVAQMADLVAAGASNPTPEGSYALALATVQRLAELAEPPPPPPPPQEEPQQEEPQQEEPQQEEPPPPPQEDAGDDATGDHTPEQAGEADETEGESDADDDSDGEPLEMDGEGDADGEAGEASETEGESGGGAGEAEGEADAGAALPGQGDSAPADCSEAAAGALNDALGEQLDPWAELEKQALLEAKAKADKEGAKTKYMVGSKVSCQDREIVPLPNAQEGAAWIASAVQRTGTVVGGLSARMVALLKARGPVRHNDREQGRLDSRALCGVRTGDRNLFWQETPAQTNDVAVVVLVDQSGSMDGMRIRAAAEAAFVLGQTLDRLGVPFEVLGWDDTMFGPGGEPKLLPWERDLYSRTEPRRLFRYKGFAEQWRRTQARLSTMRAGHNNDDCGAVLACGERLASRPEARKILLVLSDGEPCHFGSPHWQSAKHLRTAIKTLNDGGIECAGVGIQTDAPSKFYPVHARVDDLTTLGTATLAIMRTLLLGGTRATTTKGAVHGHA